MRRLASVLLVEDEAVILQSLQKHFPWQACGVDTVYAATSGVQAMDFFRKHQVDVLITDIQMPGMTGLELARAVQALGRPVSVIFISAYSDVAYLKQAISLRAAEYLLKPIDYNELRRVLLNVLSASRTREQHLESRHMVNTYTDELKLPILSALLLHRTDLQILAAQMELVGLLSPGTDNGCWSVMFSPDAQGYGQQHMEKQARQLWGEALTECYFVTLEKNCCALVMHFLHRPEDEQLRRLERSNGTWTPVVDDLLLLCGMGNEFIHQNMQQGSLGQSSLANTGALYRRITELINQRYMEPGLSASTIAQEMHYTVSYVCSVFKRECDQTIHNYINQVRLDNACRLLKTTHLRVGNIAELTGYENEAYFSRVFKKEIGITPREYRKQAGRGNTP